MKTKFYSTIILLTLSLSFSRLSNAQGDGARVLTFSGNVEYRCSLNQPWKKIQVGESLKRDCEINLTENSYAGLLFKDNRTLELIKPGKFKVKELEENLRKSENSVINKFTNYIVQEIIADKSEKKDMKTFAAVVRVRPNHIDTAFPTFTNVLEPTLKLIWFDYPSSQKYILSILNAENISVFMDLVEDTTFTLDTEKLNLTRGKIYKWLVFDAENAAIISDTISFMVVSEAERIAISDSIQMINSELEKNETALAFISLGMFCEKNSLNIEAMNQYKKAITMVPESEEFKKLYAKFLLKQKLYVLISELFEDKLIN